jgi:hypothetical protein
VRITRTSVVVAVIGVLLIVAAAVVRFAVVPSVTKLPDDLNTTQKYEGTYNGLNPAALAGGSSQLLLRNAPMTASRTYTVDSTSGDTAVVKETIQRALAGQSQPKADTLYAVDRSTFESAPAPSGTSGVSKSKGWIFTLPLHPSTDAKYTLWDAATQAAYPLTYTKTSTLDGRTVLQYQSVAKGTLADPASLGLPTSITRPQVVALQPVLASVLPPALLAQLPALLGTLPATIPVTYTSTTTSTVYADSVMGLPVKSGSTQVITAGISLGSKIQVPFTTIKLTATDASVASMADDASSKASSLNLVETIVPIVLLVLGVIALVIALVIARRAASGTTPEPRPEPRTPVSV